MLGVGDVAEGSLVRVRYVFGNNAVKLVQVLDPLLQLEQFLFGLLELLGGPLSSTTIFISVILLSHVVLMRMRVPILSVAFW